MWHILAKDGKKCTVTFKMYCGWSKGICSTQLLYHKDRRSGCLNGHCVRNRKSLTECRIQRREHCPIYQGIMKHATHCKILIVLRVFCYPLFVLSGKATILKQKPWSDLEKKSMQPFGFDIMEGGQLVMKLFWFLNVFSLKH